MRNSLILISIIWFNIGCESFLDKEPMAAISDASAYESEDDAYKALSAVYNTLLNYPGIDGYSIYDIASDNAEKGGEGPSDGRYFNELAYSTLTSTNTVASQVWTRAYLGIRRANLVIENVPNIKMNDEIRNRIIAEAKFLRAYHYLFLVILYGEVPVITEVEFDRSKIVRNDKMEVYNQIISDLEDANDILPSVSELTSDELGRVTKGAVQGYLGKTYLFMKDFEKAFHWFEKVISSNEYELIPNYNELFTLVGEFSKENIFEINHLYDPAHPALRNLASIRQGSAGMYGYGFCNPTQDFVDEFEQDDPRLWHTVYKEGDIMPDGKIADVGNSETGYMNKKAYLQESDFPPNGDPIYSERNEIKLRYGILLLWYAEAAFELGDFDEALWAINKVRKRAREGDQSILPDINTVDPDSLRSAIWHEQRVEYGMENHRYFDLIRQGRFGRVMKAYSEKYNSNKGSGYQEGINDLLPIPQNEIDLSNGRLKQNPGF